MKLQEILTEAFTADDIESLYQNVTRLSPSVAASKKALTIIKSVDADEWYTDDDIHAIYTGFQQLFGDELTDEMFRAL